MRSVTMRLSTRFVSLCAASAALAACGQGETGMVPERDPAVEQVLGSQLMVDPDLAGNNEGNAALTARRNYGLPPVEFTRDAVRLAQEQAAELVGGLDQLTEIPEPENIGDTFPVHLRYSAKERVQLLDLPEGCADNLEYSAIWAARLPEKIAIYPMGATREAAGYRSDGCDVYSVSYLAPVSEMDILSFYQALAAKSGYDLEFMAQGEMRMMRGENSGEKLLVFVAPHGEDRAHVDLAVARIK